MKIIYKITLFLLLISVQSTLAQDVFKPEWKCLKKHKALPEWFADAKLGVYFHWGVYNVPANGNEWYGRFMYTPDNTKWGKDIYDYHTKTYSRDKHYHDFIEGDKNMECTILI
tara:strand:+ start:16545 stop:16883 length:339 start_codon:yes stop_codon:yes gene_type:complete